jgi:hypothetical protein
MPDENIMKEMRQQAIAELLSQGILNGKSGCRRLDKNNCAGNKVMLNNYAFLSRRTIYILLQLKFNLFGNHLRKCTICQQENISSEHILSCSIFNNVEVKYQIMKLLSYSKNLLKKRVGSFFEG